MIDVRGLLGLLAAAGHLGIAILVGLALVDRPRAGDAATPRHAPWRPTARPLICLCLSFFAWHLADFAWRWFQDDSFRMIALTAAALVPAFLFHFVVRYLDLVERFWIHRSVLYAASASLAALGVAGIFLDPVRAFVHGWGWNAAYLAFLFPLPARAAFLLRDARASTPDPLERRRLKYVLAAVLLSLASGLVDLVVVVQVPLPPSGDFAHVVSAILLGTAILRHHLLDIQVAFRRGLLIFLLCAGAALGVFASVRLLPGAVELQILALLGVIAILFLAFAFVLRSWHAQAEQTRRLAALGELAASVAHEIRNPLAAIQGALQYVQEEHRTHPPPAGDAAETERRARLDGFLALMAEEIRRLDRIVGDVQSLSQPAAAHRQSVSLPDVVRAVLALLAPALPAGVVVREEVDPRAPALEADPDLLRQAVINLVKNAAEAQPDGGEVRVAVRFQPDARPPCVELEVADRGPGIAEEDRARLFEPFFTTKPHGSGLGLAVVKRIAEAHGGRIEAAAGTECGTRFVLTLPCAGNGHAEGAA